MPSYAVIGASRGIGLEYVRQLAAKPGSTVFAIVRDAKASTYLVDVISGLKNVHIVEGDVVDYSSLERAAKNVAEINGGKLDVLIHNAARTDPAHLVKGYDDFPSVEALDADFIDAYKINTLGVIHAISAFLPLLRASTATLKKIVVISTQGADSKFWRTVGGANAVSYSITKAATWVATTKYAIKLKDEGIVVVSLCPGAVDTSGTTPGLSAEQEASYRTELEQRAALFKAVGYELPLQSVEQSVEAQIKTIDGLIVAQYGLFLNHTGEEWVS
ncbi:NAD-P-binding protein [Fomes fomentarius]|nr:NAD-P-binding protein [Fomes fomentarius]